jgi:hypothetical protein
MAFDPPPQHAAAAPTLALALVLAASGALADAPAANPRGGATGPTTAADYDHPDQFIHLRKVGPHWNIMTRTVIPVIALPELTPVQQSVSGIGKVFHLGPLPINTQVSAYYHVATPHSGPDWEIRAQVQLLFPK